MFDDFGGFNTFDDFNNDFMYQQQDMMQQELFQQQQNDFQQQVTTEQNQSLFRRIVDFIFF